MGQANCSTCGCVDSAQMDLRRSIAQDIITANIERKSAFAQNLVQAAVPSPSSHAASPEDLNRIYAQFEDKLERVQAVWRGRQDRKQFAIMKKQGEIRHTFFTSEEIRETLRIGQFPPNVLSNSRRQYQSGAIYTGSWRGGFRHGEGVMEYPCGSRYSGKWSWGYPFGVGTFHHADGEEYVGEWKNPNTMGRGSFMLSGKKALDRWKNGLRDGYGIY